MDVNLGDGDFIQPPLDKVPNSRKTPRSINDVKFAHGFRVTILSDCGCFGDIVSYFVELPQADTLQVEDGARCLYQLALDKAAGRESFEGASLVFRDQLFQEAFLCSDSIKSLDIYVAESLYVNGSTILQRFDTR